MTRSLRRAVGLAFILNLLPILTARYRLSYDAYTHMFFADHYLRNWWSLWEPRWFGGFEVVSYPPLVHQLIAILSWALGLEAAFAVLLLTVLTAMPLGVYAFARIFAGRSVSGYAALAAAVLPSVFLSAHTFGQLPTITALLFSLWGLAILAAYLRGGRPLDGALTVAMMAATAAAHHASLMFLFGGALAVAGQLLLTGRAPARLLAGRLAWIGLWSVTAAVLVIWPFWRWGLGQTMQTPIDHLSRHNFLTDPFARLAFFWPMYGPLLVVIPWVLWSLRRRGSVVPAVLFLFLFVLGLGGTTPLPRLIFGGAWAWLTYDRFALWASVVLLLFFGELFILGRKWLSGLALNFRILLVWSYKLERHFWAGAFPGSQRTTRRIAGLAAFSALTFTALVAGFAQTIMHTEPAAVAMQPIVSFLAEGDRSQWRYLTFGFGDQIALLSRLTPAETIDGSYFTARTLPELRSSGVGLIDSAYWAADGLASLQPILQAASGRGVRWGFVNNSAYVPLLQLLGWTRLTVLENGIQVFENPNAIRPDLAPPPARVDPLAEFSWGVLPLAAFLLAAVLTLSRLVPRGAHRLLPALESILIGLLPIAAVFWIYFPWIEQQNPQVDFVYTSVLIYLSDGLAAAALMVWVLRQKLDPPALTVGRIAPGRKRWSWLLLLLAGYASLSILWSPDRLASIGAAVHLWLAVGVYYFLLERPDAWRPFALGCVAALTLEVAVGVWEFAVQSTAFLSPFNLQWPGDIEPAHRGASVVQLVDGTRWLRVYGTSPHPNILGGLLLIMLAGAAALFLKNGRAWLAILFGLGSGLLLLTFSRAAWLGYLAMGLWIVLHRRKFSAKNLLALGIAGLVGLAAFGLPLHDLIFVRAGGASVSTESMSVETRLWLADQSLAVLRMHPIFGTGIGALAVAMAANTTVGVDPVHSVPLLLASELGAVGAVLVLGLTVAMLAAVRNARSPEAVIFSAAVIGLAVAALFDHYFWTLAPAQLLFFSTVGLWQGLLARDDKTLSAATPAEQQALHA